MDRHYKWKGAALACGIFLPLALAAPAMAFTPEPAPPPGGSGGTEAPAAQPNLAPVPQGELADPLGQPGKSKGTELSIPGLGSIGTIPKLDFGLELLYGPQATPGGPAGGGVPLDQHGQEGDMQIKGTLTHKF